METKTEVWKISSPEDQDLFRADKEDPGSTCSVTFVDIGDHTAAVQVWARNHQESDAKAALIVQAVTRALATQATPMIAPSACATLNDYNKLQYELLICSARGALLAATSVHIQQAGPVLLKAISYIDQAYSVAADIARNTKLQGLTP